MSDQVETPQTEEVVQPETPPSPTPTQDKDVMVGGPEDTAATTTAPTGQDQTGYVTKDDLAAMERRLVENGMKSISKEADEMRKAAEKPSLSDADGEFAKKVADLMFTDPEEALRLQDERYEKKWAAREERQKSQQTFWEKFYGQNPVLNRHKRVVQFIMNENYAELKDMPMHDAQKILAEKSLSFVSDVAQSTGGKIETLSSAKPEALRASGSPTPTVPKQEEKVVSFCEQVQNLHKKKMGLK